MNDKKKYCPKECNNQSTEFYKVLITRAHYRCGLKINDRNNILVAISTCSNANIQ
jgi:hypothetical protein